jgi:hypothetical protein
MAAITSAVIGATTGLAAMGMSFKQAADAKSAEATAMASSKKLMEEAKELAEKDYLQGLNVPLDAYGKEYEQNLQLQQQSIQALQESDPRNLAAGLGRVGAVATDANEDTRIAMGKELFGLEKIQQEEKSRINQDLKDMSVGAAADQQMIARDAAEARNSAIQGGFQGLGQVANSVASLAPLYSVSAEDKFANGFTDTLTDDFLSQKGLTMEQARTKILAQGYSKQQMRQFSRNGYDISIFNKE